MKVYQLMYFDGYYSPWPEGYKVFFTRELLREYNSDKEIKDECGDLGGYFIQELEVISDDQHGH